MVFPGGGIFVVKGEMSAVMTAMRRGARWSSHSHQDDEIESLIKSFQELKSVLNIIEDLDLIEPNVYLTPFLNVIKSEHTTGPVTSLALSAISKFLSYGFITKLLETKHSMVPMIVHNIAEAVTYARFVGTDQSSDGAVLMKILQVLRTLSLAPEGVHLTNDSLCDIMLSCFRICCETRLNDLLRRTAEYYLKEMVQLVFMRLPEFSENLKSYSSKQFRMKTGSVEPTKTKRKSKSSFKNKNKNNILEKNGSEIEDLQSPSFLKAPTHLKVESNESSSPQLHNIVDMQGSITNQTTNQSFENAEISSETGANVTGENLEMEKVHIEAEQIEPTVEKSIEKSSELKLEIAEVQTKNAENMIESSNNIPLIQTPTEEYVNQRGIRFVNPQEEEEKTLLPYDFACAKELFRFLISLCNPTDKQNKEAMIHLGLTLLTVAFEVGADSIGKYSSLLSLMKDDLCRNLFSLLNTERLSVFAANLQVCFLMFESLRTHLKFQLELYLTKLIEIVMSESLKVTYEHKEIALDNILQLWRVPGLVTELYINYDCDMYCTNLYEDLTKLLAKNAFSATTGVYHTHMLSLDALLTVIESIWSRCDKNKLNGDQSDEITKDLAKRKKSLQGNKRAKVSENVPSKENLMKKKSIKKWLPTGTEHFNHKPKKGIQFFQEHGVLSSDFNAEEIAIFLKENPQLDKKMIGEYISNRNNLEVLNSFVKTFDFHDLRIDEALRYYLETFRLPGEAPTISLLLEHFAEHWHKSNGEPFADVDSAFTLAYAIIMLNVDQHNQIAKKQATPMTLTGFKKNVAGVNGGEDFDEDMLEEIYNSIKNDEIVMPAEQTGLVKENYLWKVLIRKGASKDGTYYHVNTGEYDKELFSLIWAPVLSALSFVFDRSEDANVYKRSIRGFECCASISAHYNLTSNLDMLILTLCKYTTFHTLPSKQITNIVNFGNNAKAQMAFKTVFNLAHQHGNSLREGWKNVFDLILSTYVYGLLPKSYVEVEDFIENSGRITLVYKEVESLQKQEAGLLSSLYSYMVSSENLAKIPSAEEQQCIDIAKKCVMDCNLEQLVTDSKFLHEDALLEMVKTLVDMSRGPEMQQTLDYNYNENVTVFFLELLVRIVIQNRDRVLTIWKTVRDHLYTLVVNAALFDYQFLLERSVIDLLRIAIRLMRNEEMSPIVLQSLRMLLLLKSATLCRISKQISFGLYELLKTSAQNIHTNADWTIVFTLLECVGAGAQPPRPVADDNKVDQAARSEGEPHNSDEDVSITDRGYTSDSELTKSPSKLNNTRPQSPVITQGSNNSGGWILVGNDEDVQPVVGRTLPPNQYNLALERNLGPHDPNSLIKCCESLAFLVRDVAHITPYNFDICVHCIRTFVEASLNEANKNKMFKSKKKLAKRQDAYNLRRSPTSSPDEDSDDESSIPAGYHQIAIQLLDLMHTLHTRTAQIFTWWAEEGGEVPEEVSLWTHGWCPLLQGIARLCCDLRKQVRMSAITYLQRALLVHDLQTLTGPEWEACFHRVLFPLLSYLLQSINSRDSLSMEETRMRAATLLSKVFLHHLTPLLSLPTFNNLWLIILDFMDKYMNVDKSDLLMEAIPESLKNMLLVMDSAKVFENPDGTKNQVWLSTWARIDQFLPNLKDSIFKETQKQENTQPNAEVKPNVPITVTKTVQHNVENAARSSIILEPPTTQRTVSSPLFAHLGQMVSTPIGPTVPTDIPGNQPPYCAYPQQTVPVPNIPNSSSPILQPTLQPGMPYMQNFFIPQCTLYNPQQSAVPPPSISQPMSVQPSSLYNEYTINPYNLAKPSSDGEISSSGLNNFANVTANETTQNVDDNNSKPMLNVENNNMNSNKQNNNPVPSNFFPSSYFEKQEIPPGSEFLFGVQPLVVNNLGRQTSDV